ncbi:MAG: NACHT domain-containing protein, partial [Alphaproteobacteria bacterium]
MSSNPSVTYAELRRYLDAVEREHGYVRALDQGTAEDRRGIRIGLMFVEPRLALSHIPTELPPDKWGETRSLLEAIREHGVLAVLGDPGSGKSTLVSWISHMLADPGPNQYKSELREKIPIPMVLRDMKLSASITWEGLQEAFLAQPFATSLREGNVLARLLDEGRAMVLIDGFDEVSDVETRRAVDAALLQGQREGAGKEGDNLWMLTSRIVGYDEARFHKIDPLAFIEKARLADEYDPLAGIKFNRYQDDPQVNVLARSSPEDSSEARTFFVAPFSDEGVDRFVHNWHAVREPDTNRAFREADEFLQALAQRTDLTQLARSPQILTMMCLIHRVDTELPEGRAMLYHKVTEAYLQKLPRRKNIKAPYPLETSKRWLARIGFELQRKRSEEVDTFHSDDAQTSGILATSAELETWLLDEAVLSGIELNETKSFLWFVSNIGGLLLARGPNRFAFLHLSFQEYFAAYYLAQSNLWQPQDDLVAEFVAPAESQASSLSLPEIVDWA